MKLAIAVTYIVDERQEALLHLHLDRIARHTSVPWTIYGSTNRLLPRFRAQLEQRDGIRLFEFAETSLRGMEEHSYYLEQLFDAALADGATHIAVLHVDSFPIADGWAERMAARLSDRAPFVSGDPITTACLLFSREFYLEQRPRLLWPDDREDPAWKAYLRERNPEQHSGIGFGYTAYRLGLHPVTLPEMTASQTGLTIFDDTVLHVQGALRLADYAGRSTAAARTMGRRGANVLERIGRRVVRGIRAVTPARLRPLVRRAIPVSVDDKLFFDARRTLEADQMKLRLERLLSDPDAVIEELERLRPPL